MSERAIIVKNLSKCYKINRSNQGRASLKEDLTNFLSSFFSLRRKQAGHQIFWALKDLTLEVNRGDVLGIIGSNGSGKSTFLKLLSRITEPTTGIIEFFGKIGALLEVGTGFNPELTGRENIFLSGAILGMKQSQIKKNFDAIVDFSGVDKFIDTPVKRYSSGMFLRLAFSVMSFLDCDILLVDEVLAVGDVEFQKKCLNKISSIVKSGKTVIYVSHGLSSVTSICNKCLYLDKGESVALGPSKEIVDLYSKQCREPESF